MVVFIVSAAYAVAHTNHYSHCNWPPDQKHRNTQKEGFDDASQNSSDPCSHGDVWLQQFHSLYRDVPTREALIQSCLRGMQWPEPKNSGPYIIADHCSGRLPSQCVLIDFEKPD